MLGSDRCQLANSANGPAPASAQRQASVIAPADDCFRLGGATELATALATERSSRSDPTCAAAGDRFRPEGEAWRGVDRRLGEFCNGTRPAAPPVAATAARPPRRFSTPA